jgi:hypothetical protein
MNSIPHEPVIEALNECETQERAQYARRLRAMPTLDVTSEMVYWQGDLDYYGLESLQDQPDETLAFLGALVQDARWKRDLCAAEIERRRKRNLLPMPGAVGLSPEVIDQLKSSVDLKDVVEYAGVEMIKRGRQWWGLCPFHPDKHPSFAVNSDKGLFFCYACRTGGDVITFLEKINGEGFIATVKRLAALANYDLPGWPVWSSH